MIIMVSRIIPKTLEPLAMAIIAVVDKPPRRNCESVYRHREAFTVRKRIVSVYTIHVHVHTYMYARSHAYPLALGLN